MNVPWSEVLAYWREAEEESWRPYYTERGFATWEEWRVAYRAALALPNREWSLVPANSTPSWFIGGFQGWKKYRPAGERATSFATVAQSSILLDNPKIAALVEDLHATTFIGLRCGNDIALIDGTHRASAYAYRAAHDMPLPACQVYIADISEDERPLFDQFRRDIPAAKKGS